MVQLPWWTLSREALEQEEIRRVSALSGSLSPVDLGTDKGSGFHWRRADGVGNREKAGHTGVVWGASSPKRGLDSRRERKGRN